MDCIEHTGSVNSAGYGTVRRNGKRVGRHVAAYLDASGSLEPGQVVMHSCHNRRCINPEHLSAGTQSKNILHSLHAGRMPQLLVKDKTQGEDNGYAKLTNEKVRRIKHAQLDYKYGQDTALARQYGVGHKTIRDIRVGNTWRSISIS